MNAARLGREHVRAIERDVRRIGIEPGRGVDIERVLAQLSKPAAAGGLGVPVSAEEFDRGPGEPSAVTYALYDDRSGQDERDEPLEYVIALAAELVGPLRLIAFLHEVYHLLAADPPSPAATQVSVPPGAVVRHTRRDAAPGEGGEAERLAELFATIAERVSRSPAPGPAGSRFTENFGGER